ncbi:MAG: ERCC4 domain-containing protein [Clostridiales bacterium]|nr:ERCC4 domain-containing protein [Clostridiales bacterium]
MTVIVDTREHPTASYKKRLAAMGVPTQRRKLDFGDYSAFVTLPDGTEYSLEKRVSIERKMGLDEICNCYCQSRNRFTKEFERAKNAGAKIYLLIENSTWEMVLDGDYRSKMNPSALTASLFAWLARYNCQIIFCKPHSTGTLVKEILYREMKERLETYE